MCSWPLGSEVRNFTIAGKLAAWEKLARGNSSQARAVVLAYSYEDWVAEPEGASGQNEKERPFEVFPLNDVYSSDAQKWREKRHSIARRINGCYDLICKKIDDEKISMVCLKDLSCANEIDFGNAEIDANASKSWGQIRKRHRDASLDLAKHLKIKLTELEIAKKSSQRPAGS